MDTRVHTLEDVLKYRDFFTWYCNRSTTHGLVNKKQKLAEFLSVFEDVGSVVVLGWRAGVTFRMLGVLRSCVVHKLRSGNTRVHNVLERGFHSILFCPGNKGHVLTKALGLNVDAVVADFEDAVAPSEKHAARKTTTDVLRTRAGERTPTVAIRINDATITEGEEDIAFLIDEVERSDSHQWCCDALVLPKCEDPSLVSGVAQRIGMQIPLWCMIETSRGVLEASRIAALPAVGGLILGSNDLTKSMQGRQTATREPLFFAMSTCVTAARAYGKFVVDGVHNDIGDQDGLRRTCAQARDFGFSGKSLIHPGQVLLQFL